MRHSGGSRNLVISIPPLAGLDPGACRGLDAGFPGVTIQGAFCETVKIQAQPFFNETSVPPVTSVAKKWR